MFTQKDFGIIIKHKRYYDIIAMTGIHIIIKSRKTKHIWDIQNVTLNYGDEKIIISHKHNDLDPFHVQPRMHPRTVMGALTMIRAHDDWHRKGRGKK